MVLGSGESLHVDGTALPDREGQELTGKLGPIQSLVVGQFVDRGHEVSIQPERDLGPGCEFFARSSVHGRLSASSRRAFRSEARAPEFRLVAELPIAEPRGCRRNVDRNGARVVDDRLRGLREVARSHETRPRRRPSRRVRKTA